MIQIRYWIEENRKTILIILGVLLIGCLVALSYYYLKYDSIKEEKKKVEEFEIELKEPKEELDIVEIETKIITVDIKGAIEEPGVYEVEEGKRVQDVINLAKGLKENADVSLINLSKKVEDEMVIIIYTKEEILALQNEEKKQWKEVECPNTPIVNDACINEGENSSEESSKVSINQGNLEELMTLPGIGESKAQAIISYREQNGGFQQVEELLNVNGIGDTIFAQLEPYIIL